MNTDFVPQEAIWISPDGNDANPGTQGSPFATVQRAQQAARERRQAQSAEGKAQAIHVVLRGGIYYLAEPIQFGPEDSGTEIAPVVYEAYADEKPVLSAGRSVTDWSVDAKGWWHAQLEDVRLGNWRFSQLFVNNQRRFRPYFPREGYSLIEKQIPPPEGQGYREFGYAAGDIQADWQNREDLEVLALHIWSASRLRIEAIDEDNRVISFNSPTWGNGRWSALAEGSRYRAENVKEEMGKPGDWYLDRKSGELTYVPFPGESPEEALVVAPRLERVIVLSGDFEQKHWVEHITFQGLTIAHTNWNLGAQGHSFPQSEVDIGSAVEAAGARNLIFDKCVIRHTGGYGMCFAVGCRDNRVENCEMVDLGAGGIKIGAVPGVKVCGIPVPAPTAETEVTNHSVTNCLIAHGGRVHPGGSGVWIGHASHNKVAQNDIFDFNYIAISVGWTWGYNTPSKAHDNEISNNHIHDIGRGVLSDLAGVYTLGFSPGTVIHGNHIHDVESFSYGGWGLYTDEGSSSITLRNNLVHDVKNGCFHQNYGRGNLIENNIFAFSRTNQVERTAPEADNGFLFQKNVIYWEADTSPLGRNWNGGGYRFDWNMYWKTTGNPILFPGNLTFEAWQTEKGQDVNSRIADPGFVNPSARDFRLKEKSPALQLGFQPFNYYQAGRTKDMRLIEGLPEVPQYLPGTARLSPTRVQAPLDQDGPLRIQG